MRAISPRQRDVIDQLKIMHPGRQCIHWLAKKIFGDHRKAGAMTRIIAALGAKGMVQPIWKKGDISTFYKLTRKGLRA